MGHIWLTVPSIGILRIRNALFDLRYLAPEYAQSGQITEKADIYSFGVVLVELVTGRKAVDLKRPKGQQCLAEWARPLLEEDLINELIDPRLRIRYSKDEVYCMMQAASLCIKRDPHLRPHMSQVLRMLEGDIMKGSSRSGRIVMDEERYMIGGGGGNGMKEMSTRHCYWESDRIMRG
ncbi:hypothetical protein L6452_14847 [Arctium lappa]|uniref:Uncharacterized protein n=1 Tax=Arctium lappa TaxID=4217 RepID=A0ACB9CM25_ARCLA|nr:hypothetical protein L6452_14847 [Arctium lappa]